MSCESIREELPLYLYGELSAEREETVEEHLHQCADCRRALDTERSLHRLMDEQSWQYSPQLLSACRRELRARVQVEASATARGWRRWLRIPFAGAFTFSLLKPLGAVALLALGFFSARLYDRHETSGSAVANVPVSTRVRYLRPEPGGQVQLVLEETRQKVLEGGIEDDHIRAMLMAATRDSLDPGLRAQTVDLLSNRCESAEVRQTLLFALQNDNNAGVRLKALDALRPFAKDRETRHVLSQVLLNDDNPGVRTQAIDLLVDNMQTDTVGILQELLRTESGRKESNPYVLERSMKALKDRNASLETY